MTRQRRLPRASIAAATVVAATLAALPTPASAARSLYDANLGDTSVSAFSMASDGSLSAVAGSPFGSGAAPRNLAVTPDAAHLYAANGTDNNVSAYSIAADGSLTPVTGSPFPGGSSPLGVAVSPDGAHLYVSNVTSKDLSAYTIAADGSLTQVTGSPYPIAGTGPGGVAVSPDGAHLFVLGQSPGQVNVFSIAADGSLTPISGSPFAAGTSTFSIAVSPDGAHLYTTNAAANGVSAFSIAADGSLTPVTGSPFADGGTSPFNLAVTPDGAHLYITNTGAGGTVSALSIAADGSLTPVTGSPFASATPLGVAVSPDSAHVYVGNNGANAVSGFDIGQSGGLSPVTGSPFAAGTGPDGVTVAPDQAPSAGFSASSVRIGQPTSFDASASSASPGQSIASYHWDFGDGATQTTSSPTTTHTYAGAGNHTATLTVTDDAGCSIARIFTGQTMSCNGSQAAQISHQATVSKATPTLSTTASAAIVYGAGSVDDTATLSGGASPGGEITFNLYRAADTTCSAVPVFTDTKDVSGNGDYDSADFFVPRPGTYRWIASYSGDSNNDAASGACDDAGESVTVKAPKVTDLHLDPDHFAPALKPTPLGPPLPKAKGGSTIKLHLNASGFVHFFVRRKGAPPPSPHRQRHGFNRILAKGDNLFHFTGNLYGRALRPGHYMLYARPVALSGRRFKRVSAPFVIATRY